MQDRPSLTWDSVAFVLALHRAGSIAGAARALGIDGTTVSRRLASIELDGPGALFVKSRGSLRATDAGRLVIDAGETMATQMRTLDRALTGRAAPKRVRVGITEALATTLVRDGTDLLRTRLADLDLELVVSNQVADLSRREADLALRLVRPESPDLVVRLIGRIRFGLYAAPSYLARRPTGPPFDDLRGHEVLAYSGPLARSPEGEWMLKASGGTRITLSTASVAVLEAAIAAGLGLGVLPRHVGDRRSDLRLVTALPAVDERRLLLVVHRDLRSSEPIRRCAAVLSDFFGSALRSVV